ncbi:hypothetical protein LVD15_01930 [Fulvivirga maritima]|uniref:hypothetical protein n=1 Tax=Fulvivirga maritima TaxID=2904247 RepID=UPI001F1B4BC1|nr:hypothetical protein [Fulvivirga maritima]UII27209.1 hypothetical protein LVD15_01930 [Fulvivirga maritima]
MRQTVVLLFAIITLAGCGNGSSSQEENENLISIPENTFESKAYHLDKELVIKKIFPEQLDGYSFSMDFTLSKQAHGYDIQVMEVIYEVYTPMINYIFDTSIDSVIVESDFPGVGLTMNKDNKSNQVLDHFRNIKGYTFSLVTNDSVDFEVQMTDYPLSAAVATYVFSPHEQLLKDLNKQYLQTVFGLLLDHTHGDFEEYASWAEPYRSDSMVYRLSSMNYEQAIAFSGRYQGDSVRFNTELLVDDANGSLLAGKLNTFQKKQLSTNPLRGVTSQVSEITVSTVIKEMDRVELRSDL